MLEARTVAVRRRQRAAGQLRLADDDRGAAQSRDRAGLAGEPRSRRRARPALRPRRSPTSPSLSTWCCSGSRTPPYPDCCASASERGDAGAVVFGSGARPAGRDRRRPRPGWRSAAAAAWASSTCRRGCARSATSSATRCPRGRSRWSRTPGRCSPRCCARTAGWSTPSPSRPARSWSPRPADYLGYALSRARDPRGRAGAGDDAGRPRAGGRPGVRRGARRAGGRADRGRLDARPRPRRRPLGCDRGLRRRWEALFAAYGVHRADDLGELVDSLECFAVGRRVRRRAGGIATVHDSGAERVLAADVAERAGRPVRAAVGSDREATGRPAGPRARAHQPARRLGRRPRHGATLRGLPGRPGRRRRGRRGRARGRPGAGVRRRRVLPARARPAGRGDRQARRGALEPRRRRRPAAGDGAAGRRASRSSRGPAPGSARWGTCATRRSGRPARGRRRSTRSGSGAGPSCWLAATPTPSELLARLRRTRGRDVPGGRRGGGDGRGGDAGLAGRAQDRGTGGSSQARRRRRPAGADGRAGRPDGVRGPRRTPRSARGRPTPGAAGVEVALGIRARPAASARSCWSPRAVLWSSCWPSAPSRCHRSTPTCRAGSWTGCGFGTLLAGHRGRPAVDADGAGRGGGRRLPDRRTSSATGSTRSTSTRSSVHPGGVVAVDALVVRDDSPD